MAKKRRLYEWDDVLRENGYTNEDIIKITLSIIEMYESAKKSKKETT